MCHSQDLTVDARDELTVDARHDFEDVFGEFEAPPLPSKALGSLDPGRQQEALDPGISLFVKDAIDDKTRFHGRERCKVPF